jgi:hypothetical protein
MRRRLLGNKVSAPGFPVFAGSVTDVQSLPQGEPASTIKPIKEDIQAPVYLPQWGKNRLETRCFPHSPGQKHLGVNLQTIFCFSLLSLVPGEPSLNLLGTLKRQSSLCKEIWNNSATPTPNYSACTIKTRVS